MVADIEQIAENGDFVTSDCVTTSCVESQRWNELRERMEQAAFGRAVLSFMRWGVVIALIAAGYLGAGAVDLGVKLAGQNKSSSQQILATSAAK